MGMNPDLDIDPDMDSDTDQPGPMRFAVWGPKASLAPAEVVRPIGLVRLRGRAVREAALAVLSGRVGQDLSLAELLVAFDDRGCEVAGAAPNKVLADALGYEMTKGRVIRVARGRYRVGVISRTTAWRIKRRWALRCWIGVHWHPDRVWRPTRWGRPVLPPVVLRLTEARYGSGYATALRHWLPECLAVVLSQELVELISYRPRGSALVM